MAKSAVNATGPGGKFYLKETESARSPGDRDRVDVQAFLLNWVRPGKKSSRDLSEKLEHSGSGHSLSLGLFLEESEIMNWEQAPSKARMTACSQLSTLRTHR